MKTCETDMVKSTMSTFTRMKSDYPDSIVMVSCGEYHMTFADDAKRSAGLLAMETSLCNGIPSLTIDNITIAQQLYKLAIQGCAIVVA